jgi:hypothetical protein
MSSHFPIQLACVGAYVRVKGSVAKLWNTLLHVGAAWMGPCFICKLRYHADK